jgi:hypothetical protein
MTRPTTVAQAQKLTGACNTQVLQTFWLTVWQNLAIINT